MICQNQFEFTSRFFSPDKTTYFRKKLIVGSKYLVFLLEHQMVVSIPDWTVQAASQGYARSLRGFGNKAQISRLPTRMNIAFCVAGTAATAPVLDLWACTVRL